MAIYRSVRLSFWTDTKVVDDFTPEDKYFFLYLMTNPHTNLSGCYEISLKQASIETGYSIQKVKALINRLETVHNVIRYSEASREILIVNWSKFNWTKSKDFQKPLVKEIEEVKDAEFRQFLQDSLEGVGTVLPPSRDGARTSVTVTDTVTVSDTDTVKEIIEFMNETCGTNYRPNTKKTKDLIRARLNENFTVDDFKTVIYKKSKQWKDDPKMCKYLRPETLFGNKFEGYLNEKAAMTFEERLAMA